MTAPDHTPYRSKVFLASKGAFSNRVSFVNCFLSPPRVTVLSAVGINRPAPSVRHKAADRACREEIPRHTAKDPLTEAAVPISAGHN